VELAEPNTVVLAGAHDGAGGAMGSPIAGSIASEKAWGGRDDEGQQRFSDDTATHLNDHFPAWKSARRLNSCLDSLQIKKLSPSGAHTNGKHPARQAKRTFAVGLRGLCGSVREESKRPAGRGNLFRL